MIKITSLYIAIVFSLSVIFFIILLTALFKKSTDKLIEKIEADDSFVEIRLRELIKKNPKSEIYVCNSSKNPENDAILERLSLDYPQIHIVE